MFPCTINGTAYPSVEFASRHIGIGTDEIKRRLALIEYPGYVSAHIAKDKKQKPKRHIDCEYLVLGKTYKSLRDIAHNVGCAVSVALHRVNNPRKPDWRRMYRTQLDGAKPMTISMDAYRIMLGK